MNKIKILSYILIIALSATSCKKEDDLGDVSNIPGLGGDTWTKTPVDNWIYDNLTAPFNIDIKYKWNQFTVGQLDKNVIPIKEELVIPVLQGAVQNVWAAPYIAETDSLFIKRYSPKSFVFAGSAAYDRDGSGILGVAGGGRQIVLFQLNYYKNKSMPGYLPSDTIIQREVFHTIHHEFAHIFDQTRQRPDEFNNITQNGYSSDWINRTDEEARESGFISAYASSQAGEDWAEMIAFLLVYGNDGFEEIVNSISDAQARDDIHAKRDVIIKYFKEDWNIDFISLQTRVRTAVENEFY